MYFGMETHTQRLKNSTVLNTLHPFTARSEMVNINVVLCLSYAWCDYLECGML